MPCMSKTLLCALAARAGLAVRQSLKVENSGGLANVVEQIGALIQAQDKSAVQSKVIDNLRMLAAITPGATLGLNDALTKTIGEIEANVDSKIKDGFAATQSKVEESISSLDAATTEAKNKKQDADVADDKWFGCIGVEQAKRVAIEAAVTAEAAANAATVQPCNDQKAATMFESDPNGDVSDRWAFACDFSNGDECDKSFAAYDQQVNQMLDTLTSASQSATEHWTDAKTRCDSAVANAGAKEQARLEAISAWTAQRTTCLGQHELRQLAMCSFGAALQSKCSTLGEHQNLIAEVDQVDGGQHSEADRATEWETSYVTKCLLNKVIAGLDLDAASLEDCRKEVNYAGDVGVLDRMQGTSSTLTSETSFTCLEKTITFKGETWNVPVGESPPSTDYTKTSYQPEVYFVEGSAPFAFCESKGKR